MVQRKNKPTRNPNKRTTRKLHNNTKRKRTNEIPHKTPKPPQLQTNNKTTTTNDNNLRQTRKQHQQTTIRLPIITTQVRTNHRQLQQVPLQNNTTLHRQLWIVTPVIIVRKNYFFLI